MKAEEEKPDETSVTSQIDEDDESIMDEDEPIQILGEIVGAFDLPPSKNLRPYCLVKMGPTIVHRTSKASGTDPIWTLSDKSLFVLDTTCRELVDEGQLHITVWHKEQDPLRLTTLSTTLLGQASVTALQMVSSREERLEVDLQNEAGEESGVLSVRFRLAGEHDVDFVQRLYQHVDASKKSLSNTAVVKNLNSTVARAMELNATVARALELDSPAPVVAKEPLKPLWTIPKTTSIITELDESELAGSTFVNALSSAFTRKTKTEQGCKRVLVKPGPNPKAVDATTYLSPTDISQQTMEPSHSWIEAGSGTIGKLYLELLQCDDLPNVDVGEAVGNVTDCFLCAVFEDVMVQTPVIDDELSPRWLPWTPRAFCINVMHPASVLYLGAFDFDLGLSDHDPLGRVAIQLGNFQRDTDYTLTYNLYPSSNVTDRTSAGSVTLRLRIEYDNEKEALMKAFSPRPKFHVNVSKDKSLKVVNYTCYGEYGDDGNNEFDLTVVRSYVNEIFGYKRVLGYCISDALKSLIFWRGQVQLYDLMLPLHSLFFFWSMVTLVERPYLLPSFTLIFIGWIMLATLTQRRQHPSPWHRCPSFMEYLEVLHHGKSSGSYHEIAPDENVDKITAYEAAWTERVEKDLQDAAEAAARQQELLDMGDESIQTKFSGMIPLDLLQRLARYQGIVGRLLLKMRFIKIILTWEEGMISFWITAGFLGAGFVSLILPWAFILTWTSRLLVWGLLGPHMMLVDLLMKEKNQDEESLAKAIEKYQSDSISARHRRQDAQKLKNAKCMAFGKNVTLVPSYNLSRHCDFPLPCSYATLKNGKKVHNLQFSKERIPGQQFFGIMVPHTESQVPELKTELLELADSNEHAERCVRAILKEEQSSLLERLRDRFTRREEQNMPASVGYELISYGSAASSDIAEKPTDEQMSDDSQKQVAFTESEESDDGPHKELMTAWKQGDEARFAHSVKSLSVHVDSERHIGVVPTTEQRKKTSLRRRTWRRKRGSFKVSGSPEERDCGVEVMLDSDYSGVRT